MSRWPSSIRWAAASRAPPSSSTSTEARAAGRGRVDEDHRQAGPPDLVDLRVVVGQADRDDPVDGRPVDRPRQGAVERRDEVEPVAVLLGDAPRCPR